MKNPWIFPATALVVGAFGGFITGQKINSGNDAAAKDSGPAHRTRSSNRAAEQAASSQSQGGGKHASRINGVEDIARMPGNSDRVKALLDFYAGLTPEQLEAEARKLDNLPVNERIMASILLFGRWAEEDPTAAMAFSNTMGFAGAFVRPTILQSWASVDPANAAKYYSSNPREFAMMGMMGGGGRGPMGGMGPASIIGSEWARQDPAAALAWAGTLTNDKGQALNSVLGEVAKTDPKKAAAMLAGLTGSDTGEAYRTIASQYGAKNFSEAQAWIRTLPSEDQAEALASAIGGLSNSDPQAAAKQVALMAAGEAKDRAVAGVVEDWARLNPQGAAEFLKQQDSAEAQQSAMQQLMPAWVAKDPKAALDYANSYAAGDVRDSALQSYVWSNNTAAPAELMQVAETVTDERDRTRTMGVAAARWMREDPEAATNYIQASTALPDDAKQRVLEGRGMGGGRGPRGGR